MDVHGVVHRHRVHKLPVLDVAQSDARVDAGRIEGTPVDPESHAAAHHAWPHGLSKHEAPHPRWRWKGFDGYQFLRQRDNAIGLSGIGESWYLLNKPGRSGRSPRRTENHRFGSLFDQ